MNDPLMNDHYLSDKLPAPPYRVEAWDNPLWEDWELDAEDDPPFDAGFGDDLADGSK